MSELTTEVFTPWCTSDFVQVVVTLYDVQGDVAGVDFTFADIDPLPAGEISPFELFIENRDEFATYVLQV